MAIAKVQKHLFNHTNTFQFLHLEKAFAFNISLAKASHPIIQVQNLRVEKYTLCLGKKLQNYIEKKYQGKEEGMRSTLIPKHFCKKDY